MELAAAIHALASNPERAAAMGAAAHDHVASRFTWPIVADRILTTLDAIRDARRTRSSAVA
jgi:glycosyltransferase involved in cell wall biosynthesis